MKGVVVEVDTAKCIVLFNNGKIGSLPKPPHCEVGMVITVSFNRKFLILPLIGVIVLLAAGTMLWLVLRSQSMSPERFCNNPFLRKDIIFPLREYAGFDELFAHLGDPIREFSPKYPNRLNSSREHHNGKDRFYDYPEQTDSQKRYKGFHYRYYRIITAYPQDGGKVLVSEIMLNSKEVIYNGNFSIGDERSKIETIFSGYITRSDVLFFSQDREMRFTMKDKTLLFRFNGRNQLSGIRIMFDL